MKLIVGSFDWLFNYLKLILVDYGSEYINHFLFLEENKIYYLSLCAYSYTDGQKKRYSKILSCIACGSQTRAAQAYRDQNLESSLGVILIC